jgi:hypothetical protein
VTAGRRYLLGLAGVAVLGGCLVALTAAPSRAQVAWGAAVGFVVQAPLGWWAVQSLGTERFIVIWGIGLLARLMVVAVVAMAIVPMLGWNPGPTLGALVTVLVTLLFVEGITAWKEHSGEGGSR